MRLSVFSPQICFIRRRKRTVFSCNLGHSNTAPYTRPHFHNIRPYTCRNLIMIGPYFCAQCYGRNTVRKLTINGRIRTVSFDLGSFNDKQNKSNKFLICFFNFYMGINSWWEESKRLIKNFYNSNKFQWEDQQHNEKINIRPIVRFRLISKSIAFQDR
jgi:hypothetical protein